MDLFRIPVNNSEVRLDTPPQPRSGAIVRTYWSGIGFPKVTTEGEIQLPFSYAVLKHYLLLITFIILHNWS